MKKLKLLKMSRKVIDLLNLPNTIEDLIEYYRSIGGFMASYLCDVVDVLLEMLKDDETTIIMSFTANLIATGLRGLISKLINHGLIDVIITTTGTLDHDIAKSLGGEYLRYYFEVDDVELKEKGYHRIGNIILKHEHYGPLIEKFVHNVLQEIYNKGVRKISVRELIWYLGEKIPDEKSIIKQAYLNKVPIYVPGFVDGAFGTALLTFNEILRSRSKEQITVDVLLDEKEISEIIFNSKKLGGIIIGGGISKHHLIWWSQFKEGLDYAIYITTAVEWDGSLSGAKPREAITWNKIKPNAKIAYVYGDATILLPIIFSYVIKKIPLRKRKIFI